LRAAVAGVLVVAAIVVVVLIASGGSSGHRISVVVGEATNVVPGQYVRSGGSPVGEVKKLTPVNGGRAARIDMEIDNKAWPLPAGTKMTLRWGGTVNFSNRYIELDRGPDGGAPMAANGRFPTASFTVPVEFDALLRTFDAPMRRDTRGFLNTAGKTLNQTKPALKRVLDDSPGAVQQAGFVLRDLDAERYPLRTLVVSADNVLGAVQRARPELRTLLSGAADTFDAIAAQSASLQQSLQRAPQLLSVVRSTLKHADSTLDLATTVTGRIAPGVDQLRKVSTPLNDTLKTVVRVAPDAKSTLTSLGAATPDLNPLITTVRVRSPQLQDIGKQAVDNLNCIRPYTPSVLSFFSNWGDFFSFDDGRDKLIRAQVQNFLPAEGNVMPYNSGQAAKLFPGLTFGFPRPPGTDAGQPWFLPECGAGPDALDPNKDPEARAFNQVFKIPSLRSSLLGEAGK
jgi:ABC-type transporter Mla subunit MlaD